MQGLQEKHLLTRPVDVERTEKRQIETVRSDFIVIRILGSLIKTFKSKSSAFATKIFVKKTNYVMP